MTSSENRVAFLKQSMTEYFETAEPSYSKKDSDECEKILNEYLSGISQSQSKEEGMKNVQNAAEN